jgi:hypothetical protein
MREMLEREREREASRQPAAMLRSMNRVEGGEKAMVEKGSACTS